MSARRLLLGLALGMSLGSASAAAHEGHTDDVAWRACDQHGLGDACAYTDHARATYRGTCRSMSGELLCVRNRPIERPEDARAGTPALALLAALPLLAIGGVVGWRRRRRSQA